MTTLGVASNTVNVAEGAGAYDDFSGGRTMRMITPTCPAGKCTWTEDIDGMPINRWYPTIETLEDGTVIVLGGELYGGFVNSVNQRELQSEEEKKEMLMMSWRDVGQSNPTYEFWPTRGPPVASAFLADTQPANLCKSPFSYDRTVLT